MTKLIIYWVNGALQQIYINYTSVSSKFLLIFKNLGLVEFPPNPHISWWSVKIGGAHFVQTETQFK